MFTNSFSTQHKPVP